MKPAFYNEIDPFAAAWLRELIKAGHIAPGIVDERSIEDIKPRDLDGFSQCHFFAGIGVWSLALRRAGWPDDRPVWTGSCPCQPFSAAGQGVGFDDERHLWPHFHWLIQECRPASVLGEQVASKDADPWIDLVQIDLEALGFAFGAVAFPSASVGAPHIRDRTYWVAHAQSRGHQRSRGLGESTGRNGATHGGAALILAHNHQHGRGALPLAGLHDAQRDVEPRGGAGGLDNTRQDHDAAQVSAASVGQSQADRPANLAGGSGISPSGLADTDHGAEHRNTGAIHRAQIAYAEDGRDDYGPVGGGEAGERPGPTNGPWRDADWLLCRDGKWRPVEPGTFPLAHGAPARVGRLRGYGNAINAYQAQIFIEAVMA